MLVPECPVQVSGQPFSTEYEVCYEQAGGDTSFLAAKYEEAEFSGYDSSKADSYSDIRWFLNNL